VCGIESEERINFHHRACAAPDLASRGGRRWTKRIGPWRVESTRARKATASGALEVIQLNIASVVLKRRLLRVEKRVVIAAGQIGRSIAVFDDHVLPRFIVAKGA